MKHLFDLREGRGNSTYSAPEITLIEIATESGFAASGDDMTDTDIDGGLE